MLRGKFGQIGSEFRDGHVTMDAFEQAAFREHIRSGERIMYLASLGQLKHKKTRNTIAAESTPRSSCPSGADTTTAAHAAAAAAASDRSAARRTSSYNRNRPSDPVSQEVNKAVSAAAEAHNSREDPVEPEHGKRRTEDVGGDSSPRSHPHATLSATAYRQGAGCDHDEPSTSKTPPTTRRHMMRVTSSDRRKLESDRPRSAGPVRRRPRTHCVGTGRQATQDDTATTARKATTEGIPLHVGPEIESPAADVARACGARGERPTNGRRRPASAGGTALDEKGWRTAQRSPSRAVHRGFGAQGGRGGGGRSSGRCGGRADRDVHHTSGDAARPTPKARAPGADSTARSTAEGSFAERVLKSARRFADYDYIGNTTTTNRARPKSAGAAAAPPPPATPPTFDPGSPEARALALEARFMPIGAIHKAFKGRRLAAVQTWDPHAAAAVRAARAEKLLVRKRWGAGGSRNAGEALRCLDHRQERGRPSSARRLGRQTYGNGNACRRGEARVGGAAGSCGPDNAVRKGCRGDRARREVAPAVSVTDGAGDSPHGTVSEQGGAGSLDPKELDEWKLARGGSPRPSTAASSRCRGSTAGSARGSEKRGDVTVSTARASTAAGYSSRGSGSTSDRATSLRSASTSRCISTSRSDEIAAEEKRARLLAHLETLRRRMEDAEGLLREVDSSLLMKPKNRPGKTASRATPKFSGRDSAGTRASSAATPGNTSAKSSAGYGAFNLGERRTCPLVVTHPANACMPT